MQIPFPVVGLAAASGTGKTTLLLKVIPLLKSRGVRVALIKRAHHTFDTDKPGKDSYELRKAGASQVLVGSDHRWALVVENDLPKEPTLTDLLEKLHPDALDLVIVEGFKFAPIPKIEIHRPSLGHRCWQLPTRISSRLPPTTTDSVRIGIPVLDLNRPEEITEFICQRFVAPGMAGLLTVPKEPRVGAAYRRISR